MKLGIDLGGTKIEAIVLSPKGTELSRQRIPTPNHVYEKVLDAVLNLIRDMLVEFPECESIGIGMPGSIEPGGETVRNSNTLCLNGKNFKLDVENEIGRGVKVANDANCFALSEAVDGAGASFGSVFGVILGTGVGGGLVYNRELIVGANRIAGEWGHNLLPEIAQDCTGQVQCYCGSTGCIETYLSGPALSRQYWDLTGETMSAKEIAVAGPGNGAAEKVMASFELRLAKSLASVINIFDPEAIILGGGLGQIARIYESVPRLWRDYIFSNVVATKLLKPVHGDSSGVRGAAWL